MRLPKFLPTSAAKGQRLTRGCAVSRRNHDKREQEGDKKS
jgi:hypothetical protein